MATISEHLADFAAAVVAGHAPEPVLRMRLYALDTLAVTLAGTVSPSSAPVLRTILASAGKPEATVMTAGRVDVCVGRGLGERRFRACAGARRRPSDRRSASGRGGGAGGACRRRGRRSDGADVPARAARRLRGRLPPRRGLPRQPVRSCSASDGALRHTGHGRRGRSRDGARPRRIRARARHCRHAGLGPDGVAGGRLLDQAPASGPRGACGDPRRAPSARGLHGPRHDLRGRRRLLPCLLARRDDRSRSHDARPG